MTLVVLKSATVVIPPDYLETRQASDESREQHLATCPVSDLSRQHFDAQQQPVRVHQQMPFAALNLLT
jgi:hypothetical protein